MNLDKLINEMGRELLPSASSEEDVKILKQLKLLYKKDTVEFKRKLKRINLIRKSEGLEPLHKNEILSKSLKKDLKGKTRKGKTKIFFKQNNKQSIDLDHIQYLAATIRDGRGNLPIIIDGEEHNIFLIVKRDKTIIGSDDIKGTKGKTGGEIWLPEHNKKIVIKYKTRTSPPQGGGTREYIHVKIKDL